MLNSKSIDQRWIDTCKIIEHCQLKIKCGLIDDIRYKPKHNEKESINDDAMLDINEDDISLSCNKSQMAVSSSPTKSLCQPNTDNFGGFDEDGSTTLSSNSPICTHRKSVMHTSFISK